MQKLFRSLVAIFLCALASSCAGDPGHFDGQGRTRQGTGNAPLVGPNAADVIYDVHRDRARQRYEDRTSRRYHGKYD